MTPDRLRSLLADATPGPWTDDTHESHTDAMGRWVWPAVSGPPTGTGYPVVYEYGQVLDTTQNVADAALIALTPEIAEWAADAYALLSDLSWNHMSVSRAALVDRFEEIGSDGKAAA